MFSFLPRGQYLGATLVILLCYTGVSHAQVRHDSTLTGNGTNASPLGVANGGVDTPQIAGGAVTTGKIAAGAVATNKLAAGAVTIGKIADAAVTAAKLNTSNAPGEGQQLTYTNGTLAWQTPSSVAGRETFQKQVTFTIIGGTNNAQALTLPVPAGKRAVIEHVTGRAECTCFVTFSVFVTVQEPNQVASVEYWLVSNKQGNLTHIASQPLRTYSTQTPILAALSDPVVPQDIFVMMSISGYYEDLP